MTALSRLHLQEHKVYVATLRIQWCFRMISCGTHRTLDTDWQTKHFQQKHKLYNWSDPSFPSAETKSHYKTGASENASNPDSSAWKLNTSKQNWENLWELTMNDSSYTNWKPVTTTLQGLSSVDQMWPQYLHWCSKEGLQSYALAN